MEKLKPTYDLDSLKSAFSAPEKLVMTTSAAKDARALGFALMDIVAVIQAMERKHLIKSMTSFANHKEWQDVYHVPYDGRLLYVKFTADRVTEFRLLSFKEK